MNRKFRSLAAALSLAVLAPVAMAGHHEGEPAEPGPDIVETAVAAGQFETLATALAAADLVDTLKGDGPFTVFAPTDAAFAELPAGTLESLLDPANRDQLVAILTYHVVPGAVPSERVAGMAEATTVQGDTIDIAVRDDVVRIDGATVVKADVMASNGVIHVIDQVLMPGN